MAIVRPRLTDHYGIPLRQEELDFPIPFLDEDIPLYVDPFLLWKIPSLMDNSLHTTIISSFNNLGRLYTDGKEKLAIDTLIALSECDEVGLGNSKTRVGKKIGEATAIEILNLFRIIPQIRAEGFSHFEEIQLLIDGVSKDRICDISCSLIKSFLIDYSMQQCQKLGIPMEKVTVALFDYKSQQFISEDTLLPVNPDNKKPILLTPKRWLRFSPWINYEDYFHNHYIKDVEKHLEDRKNRVEILEFNRHNYGLVASYTEARKRDVGECKNDPLFSQIPVLSARRKWNTIKKLPTGKDGNADKQYEELMVQLLSSMLYPHLDFADTQCRTDSGLQIRDLIFYNNRSYDFLQDIYDTYDCRQLVIELKNVHALEREHINQINRYMTEQFGRFGVIFTRNRPPKNIYKHTIDLWSGQRKCIVMLDDSDLESMVEVYESKQRNPIEFIKRKFVQFTRDCPA
jgi:hypothetical protein